MPVPGGLGVTEGLMQQQLLHIAAMDTGAATTAMLLIRIATLWWAVGVGFVALGLLRLKFGPDYGARRRLSNSTKSVGKGASKRRCSPVIGCTNPSTNA